MLWYYYHHIKFCLEIHRDWFMLLNILQYMGIIFQWTCNELIQMWCRIRKLLMNKYRHFRRKSAASFRQARANATKANNGVLEIKLGRTKWGLCRITANAFTFEMIWNEAVGQCVDHICQTMIGTKSRLEAGTRDRRQEDEQQMQTVAPVFCLFSFFYSIDTSVHILLWCNFEWLVDICNHLKQVHHQS